MCPLDDMEWELKVRNEAMKGGCASEQLDELKQGLFMFRMVVDTVVQAAYIVLQIAMALFRLLIPSTGASVVSQIMAEINFWFNKLIIIATEALKRLPDMIFDLIFSNGPLGQAMKKILEWLCKIMKTILWIWNETGTLACCFWVCIFFQMYMDEESESDFCAYVEQGVIY